MIGNKKQCIDWLLETEADIFEVNIYKKQRNNDQNAKYWKLLYKLSLKLGIGVHELHKQMLRDYSKQGPVCAPSTYDMRGVKYYDVMSKFIKDGVEFISYQVYTPSHELRTDEFAILLNGLIQECEQQGIDTRSPDEIERDNKLYGI